MPGLDSLPVSRALEILEQTDSSSPLHRSLAALLDRKLLSQSPYPDATPRSAPRFLTLGMATYDDYDGVYFSAQAIRLFHPEVTSRTEILVIDNHPDGPCAAALKKLETSIDGFRYVPFASAQGTAVRDVLFRESGSPFVLSMDSHVLFAPGGLARLIEFLQAQTESCDLWHGPLVGDDLRSLSAYFAPVWSNGMYGVWTTDPRAVDPNGPPFEIPMQGAGVFACRRAAWPGYNPRFSGFGGEEGYLHEKVRQRGGKIWCLPFLRWLHRFERPCGVPYTLAWRDRVRNYLIGWQELGLDPGPVRAHFAALLGPDAARPIFEGVEREISGPFHAFDGIYSTAAVQNRSHWSGLALDSRIRFSPPPETEHDAAIGQLLAHRRVLGEAAKLALESVLVFDPDFDPETDHPGEIPSVRDNGPAIGEHAIAYSAAAIRHTLAQIPVTPSAAALWLREHGSLRAFLERGRGATA